LATDVRVVRLAESDRDIAACFPVMSQLRQHLKQDQFVTRVRLQEQTGYRLAMLEDAGAVRALGGFRIVENLFSGRMFYVDDLVTDDRERSKGCGTQLIQWLIERARTEECQSFELDSGVQRFDAHRFYMANKMIISSHHFRLKLGI
jgi:GNAT superfamily N-acetyltransferase